MARKAKVRLEPYYSSYIGFLERPDGKEYCFGELPKFLERTLGYGWHEYVLAVQERRTAYRRTAHRRMPLEHALAEVLLGAMRDYAEYDEDAQVYAALDAMEPWEYYA